MKFFATSIAASLLALAAVSPALADTNLGVPDTLQKNQGPGNLDATAPDLKKKAVPAATPMPTPLPKVPEKKKSGY